ncbi:hypothetical protein [Rarobacter incanus]|uniref:hypothetical protein n=1 Tax=Rarobacter incanus TaxID=153494 RepID=UPI001154AAAB|nr:hypothetical protein [Rarobacter incanus]
MKAKGSGLTYQWSVKARAGLWKRVSGKAGKKKTLVLKAKGAYDGASVRVVVGGKGTGKKTSRTARLTVISRPTFELQPASPLVDAGSALTLKARASGNAVKYRWERSSNNGASWQAVTSYRSSPDLKLTPKLKESGNRYRVTAKNAAGIRTSRAAIIVVNSTRNDAYAEGSTVVMNNWTVLIDRAVYDLTDSGDQLVFGMTKACYRGPGKALAWSDLAIEYVGTNGVVYDNGDVFIDGDIWDAPEVYTGGCVAFPSFAFPAHGTALGGVWRIKDRSDWNVDSVAFVEGPTKS